MKLIFALLALFCTIAFVTASVQSELFTVNELAAIERGIRDGRFTQAQRELILEALEEQTVTITKLESGQQAKESWISRAIIHNKYVHWAAIGVGAVLVLAAAIIGTIIAVRKFKASRAKKTEIIATDEKEQWLLSTPDTI